MNPYESIPEELRALPQWVVHKANVPYQPGTQYGAKAGQPNTWTNFSTALQALSSGQYDGLGFEFHNNGIVGIDLDHVRNPDNKNVLDWALKIVLDLDSYTEISPSGTGLHIFVKGEIPANGRKKVVDKESGQAIELYKAQRYFTMTGNVFHAAGRVTEQRKKVLKIYDHFFREEPPARPAPAVPSCGKNYLAVGLEKDEKLRALWNGERPNNNESTDDVALMNKLAYWCNCQEIRMINAFLSSPHSQQKDDQHQKKAGRKDYLKRTAVKAIQDCKKTAEESEAEFQAQHPNLRQDFSHLSSADVFGRSVPAEKKVDIPKLNTISAVALQDKDLPPIRFIVKDLFPQGLALLASPPKYGKSWLVLDLCLSVAAGKPFLKHQTVKSGCLYLALEDSEHRLQDRMNKVLNGEKAPEQFDYATLALDIGHGLMEQLEEYIETHPNAGLIVIDTPAKGTDSHQREGKRIQRRLQRNRHTEKLCGQAWYMRPLSASPSQNV